MAPPRPPGGLFQVGEERLADRVDHYRVTFVQNGGHGFNSWGP